jgi:PucR family transcriptional regulator, purine catabolism regulatory protein
MTRPVRRARLASTTEHLRQVASAELVVTNATTLFEADEDWERLLAHFDTAKIAGLAVHLENKDELPAALLAIANRLSLPVITFPAGISLSDATTVVLDALLDAQEEGLQRVLDIHQRFTRIVVAGGGVPEIARTLHELLKLPVAVVDTEGTMVVAVPSDTADRLDVADSTHRHPITAGDHNYGEIVAFGGGLLDEHGEVAMQRAAMGIAVRQAQATAVAEAQERFASISLEELIAGHAGDAAEVAERAISFGWDLTRPRAVLLASVDPPQERTMPPGVLETIAASARATLGREAIVWTRSATIAALLAPVSDEPDERRRIAEGLRRELDARLRSVTVSIGVGRRVKDPASLRQSFVEASRAVDVGRWAKGRHVTEVYDQLGIERLLASTPADDLAEFVEHAIGPLIAHDRSHQTDLVGTLAIWLETRNMAEAARQTYVHYNTLKNRLERIEAILGPVLSDAARSLECEVAIYVARHYDGPWANPLPE